MVDISKIKKAAKAYIKNNPYDYMHDIFHHEAVEKNCIKIVRDNGLEGKVDMATLVVAALLHDAERDSDEKLTKMVTEMLKKIETPKEFVRKVIEIISEHSFGKRQTSMEAKILYDADKLEYVSIERMRSSLNRFPEKTRELEDKYMKLWKLRIVSVPESLNFDLTRKDFDKRIKGFVNYLELNHPRVYKNVKDIFYKQI